MQKDEYISVATKSEGLYKDKGSRFISYVFPICDPQEVKPLVDSLKKEHHAARHCCFAWRVGNDMTQYRVNDDSEPSGSAGRPILAAIDSEGLSDVLVVVVRYFGGILLGVPGLIQAYRSAAADALSKAGRRQKMASESFELGFAYEHMQTVLDFVRRFAGASELSRNFDLDCRIVVAVPQSEKQNFEDKIKHINDEKGTRIQCRPL